MTLSGGTATSHQPTSLRRNLIELALLLVDCLPQWVVSLEAYRLLRRRTSATPQRFDPRPDRSMPFTTGDWRERKIASRHADLCIEGFPGSGNSFASNSMRHSVNRPANIESHFHQTVQLKRALHFGIPLVVVVRDPQSACSSLKAKSPLLADGLVLLRWIHYHHWVARHLDRLDVFLFDRFTRDVDRLRRDSPAIASLVSRKIEPHLEYRRAASRPMSIDASRSSTRHLLTAAQGIYRRIEEHAESRESAGE